MDFLVKCIKVFWYGVILNPYFITIFGGNLIFLLLIKKGMNRYAKWLSISTILILFLASLYVKNNQESDSQAKKKYKEEMKLSIIEEMGEKPLEERNYYVAYKSFRDSLERISDFKKSTYHSIDSIRAMMLKEILQHEESIYDTLTIEEVNKRTLKIDEKISRTFFDPFDRKNNKLYSNIYLPLVDSVYDRLNQPSIFYIHEWKSRPSRDSIFWQFTIDYETNCGREEIKANYNLIENAFEFRK